MQHLNPFRSPTAGSERWLVAFTIPGMAAFIRNNTD